MRDCGWPVSIIPCVDSCKPRCVRFGRFEGDMARIVRGLPDPAIRIFISGLFVLLFSLMHLLSNG